MPRHDNHHITSHGRRVHSDTEPRQALRLTCAWCGTVACTRVERELNREQQRCDHSQRIMSSCRSSPRDSTFFLRLCAHTLSLGKHTTTVRIHASKRLRCELSRVVCDRNEGGCVCVCAAHLPRHDGLSCWLARSRSTRGRRVSSFNLFLFLFHESEESDENL